MRREKKQMKRSSEKFLNNEHQLEFCVFKVNISWTNHEKPEVRKLANYWKIEGKERTTGKVYKHCSTARNKNNNNTFFSCKLLLNLLSYVILHTVVWIRPWFILYSYSLNLFILLSTNQSKMNKTGFEKSEIITRKPNYFLKQFQQQSLKVLNLAMISTAQPQVLVQISKATVNFEIY